MQYNPAFVFHKPILSNTDKQFLSDLASAYTLSSFKKDVRNIEEMMVDFVYTSAKIEGNTYDRIDTDNLLRLGITAGGKRYSDAVMLFNLRNAFTLALDADKNTQLDKDYLCDLHKVLMKDLLPSNEQGIVRTTGVTIGATKYKPLSSADRLNTELKGILLEANKYDNPFEQAIYLHCNLAYLQYFRDGNKRSARMIQTASLVKSDVLPLFFNDSLIDRYVRGTVSYYETGDYQPYVEFFKDNYRLVINNFLDVDQDSFPGQS